MKQHPSILVLALAALFPWTGGVHASEPNAWREQAAALKKEANELAAQGKKEQSERLAARAGELLRLADEREATVGKGKKKAPVDLDREIAELEEKLADLHARRGKHQGPRFFKKVPPPKHPEQIHKAEETARRAHHLRVAAENLKAAGAHELAGQLAEKAEVLERESREASARARHDKRGSADPASPPVQELIEQLQALRKEVDRLRAEVHELRNRLGKP